MDANEISLKKFFRENDIIIIPVYQRNYDWRKYNCLQLWKDLEKIIENSKSHFLGTLVCQAKSDEEYIIIDGQQRITSVILIARAICALTNDKDLKEDIISTLIKRSTGKMKNQCKLRPTEFDRDVFIKLMDENFSEII